MFPKCGDMQGKEGDKQHPGKGTQKAATQLGIMGLPAILRWYKVFWYLSCGLPQDVCARARHWQHTSRRWLTFLNRAQLFRGDLDLYQPRAAHARQQPAAGLAAALLCSVSQANFQPLGACARCCKCQKRHSSTSSSGLWPSLPVD